MYLIWKSQPRRGFIYLKQVNTFNLLDIFIQTLMTPLGGHIPRYVSNGSLCWYDRILSLRWMVLNSINFHFGLHFFGVTCFSHVTYQFFQSSALDKWTSFNEAVLLVCSPYTLWGCTGHLGSGVFSWRNPFLWCLIFVVHGSAKKSCFWPPNMSLEQSF